MPIRTYADCPHLQTLIDKYPAAPSYALVRTPELQYLAASAIDSPSLDHCCGDGFFASLFSPGGLTAGVDFSSESLDLARQRKTPDGRSFYGELRQSDVSRSLPWPDATFRTVVNNSGLEHVAGLDGALAEVSRVLQPGGFFHFTLPARRLLDWWPEDLDLGSREDYCRCQPMHNLLGLDEWRARLASCGLDLYSFESHFDRAETQICVRLDYFFSMHHFRKRRLPLKWALLYSHLAFARLSTRRVVARRTDRSFPSEDTGGFYCITAIRTP